MIIKSGSETYQYLIIKPDGSASIQTTLGPSQTINGELRANIDKVVFASPHQLTSEEFQQIGSNHYQIKINGKVLTQNGLIDEILIYSIRSINNVLTDAAGNFLQLTEDGNPFLFFEIITERGESNLLVIQNALTNNPYSFSPHVDGYLILTQILKQIDETNISLLSNIGLDAEVQTITKITTEAETKNWFENNNYSLAVFKSILLAITETLTRNQPTIHLHHSAIAEYRDILIHPYSHFVNTALMLLSNIDLPLFSDNEKRKKIAKQIVHNFITQGRFFELDFAPRPRPVNEFQSLSNINKIVEIKTADIDINSKVQVLNAANLALQNIYLSLKTKISLSRDEYTNALLNAKSVLSYISKSRWNNEIGIRHINVRKTNNVTKNFFVKNSKTSNQDEFRLLDTYYDYENYMRLDEFAICASYAIDLLIADYNK